MTISLPISANKIPPGMELVSASRYRIPILDILSIEEEDFTLGGPGLVDDVFSLGSNSQTGKFYFLFTEKIEEAKACFSSFTSVFNDCIDALFISETFSATLKINSSLFKIFVSKFSVIGKIFSLIDLIVSFALPFTMFSNFT